MLESERLEDLFEKVVGRYQFDYAKPDPGGFDLVFDPDKQSLRDFVMIGDSLESDAEASKSAGIDFVFYQSP